MAQNKPLPLTNFTPNREPDGTLRPPPAPGAGGLPHFQGSSSPQPVPQAGWPPMSPYWVSSLVVAKMRERLKTDSQWSRSPQGPEEKGRIFPQKTVRFQRVVKAPASSGKSRFCTLISISSVAEQSQGRSLPRTQTSTWGSTANFNMCLVASLSVITKMVK